MADIGQLARETTQVYGVRAGLETLVKNWNKIKWAKIIEEENGLEHLETTDEATNVKRFLQWLVDDGWLPEAGPKTHHRNPALQLRTPSIGDGELPQA